MAEYRSVLTDPYIVERYPELTNEKVEIALRRLRYVGDVIRPTAEFHYPRDPKDQMFVELAISGRATHIVSADKDLLSLPYGHSDPARRFRQRAGSTLIVGPAGFLAELDGAL
jgi:predicted nucleic acid-binding protein